jgi:hypothetical protein
MNHLPRRPLPGSLLLAALLAVGLGCSGQPTPPPEADEPAAQTDIHFEDVTAQAGIDFTHFDTATPTHYIMETMGSGLAWIDHDNDGLHDLYCAQAQAILPESGSPQPTARFYRNTGNGRFVDATRLVGLDQSGFGMGCAVGDFDNDGFDDLAVTYFKGLRLYHNRPDGQGGRRFVEVSQEAGLRNPHWGTSCGWGDVDGDGWLDLYVCNYVEVDLEGYRPCVHPRFKENYVCPPRAFPGASGRLFRNNGNGTFSDVSESSGVASTGAGLGVVLVDLDADGRQDIYVANDMKPAFLFHNQGGGKFVEKGVLSGSGLQSGGRYMAGMGIALGDVEGTGRPSLLVTNYHNEPNNLFLNRGKLYFADGTHTSGLGPGSMNYLGFGAVMVDANLDSQLDVVVANGHVLRNAELLDQVPYEQTAQVFEGLGGGRFRDVSTGAGAYFRRKLVGRGLAWCDFDNDGRPDLAYTHNAGPLVLLRNTSKSVGHSLSLELVGDGKKSNRNAIGAVVEIKHNGRRQVQWVHGGGSYLSANDRRLIFGLGESEGMTEVEVTWPSGHRQQYGPLKAGVYRLHEGQASAESR